MPKQSSVYIRIQLMQRPMLNLIQSPPEDSWFFNGPVVRYMNTIIAQGAPGLKKNSDLNLFSDFKPKDDSSYIIEIGAELPFILPQPTSQTPFFWHDISVNGETKRFYFSNQTINVYANKDISNEVAGIHAVVPGPGLDEFIKSMKSRTDFKDHVFITLPAKTFAISKFIISAQNIDQALELHFESITSTFIGGINNLLRAIKRIRPKDSSHTPPFLHENMFPLIWALIEGKETGVFKHLEISPYVPTIADVPLISLSKKETERLNNINDSCWGSLEYNDILYEAKSWLSIGNYTQSLLQSVFASDACTTQFTDSILLKKGISKNKLNNADRELTYSIRLNIIFQSLHTNKTKIPEKILKNLNMARTLRNEIAHGNPKSITKEQATSAIEAAEFLINHIHSLKKRKSK